MLDPGQQIGAYTVLRQLGSGGMGAVFLAEHRHMHRKAAIKVLLPELSNDPEAVQRLFKEARLLGSLNHPNIVNVLDCDLLPGGRAYLIMEYLEGESLRERFERLGPSGISIPSICAVIARVCEALGAAHDKGIVHRDLKPENIFITTESGRGPEGAGIKLLDFGIAKLARRGREVSLTQSGAIMGTPLYMSPEQCRGAPDVDGRSDIYSLGCIFYEALAGEPPFARSSYSEVLVGHLSEPPPDPGKKAPNLAPGIRKLVQSMLAKEPKDRPQSTDAVIAALAFWLDQPPRKPPRPVTPPHTEVVESFTPFVSKELGSPATLLGLSDLWNRYNRASLSKRIAGVALVAGLAGGAVAFVLTTFRSIEERPPAAWYAQPLPAPDAGPPATALSGPQISPMPESPSAEAAAEPSPPAPSARSSQPKERRRAAAEVVSRKPSKKSRAQPPAATRYGSVDEPFKYEPVGEGEP